MRAYFDRVAAADAAGLRAIVTHDLRWVVPKGAIPPYAGVHEGANVILEMMLSSVGATFVPGSQRAEIANLLHGDDECACEVRIWAEAADGRAYENDYTFWFAFREGAICEIREYVDTRTAALFFGA